MRAFVQSVAYAIDGDPEQFSGDPAEFGFYVDAVFGPEEDGPGDIFGFMVCSPEWLDRRCQAEGFVNATHHIVVRREDYSNAGLHQIVERWASTASGPDWHTLAKKLSLFGAWEFDGYLPSSRE